jgi:protein TonB
MFEAALLALAAPQSSEAPPLRDISERLAPLISAYDYPDEAIRNHEQGVVRFAVVIGINGRIKNCTIMESSGSRVLDAQTCKLIRQRARFTPVRDANGHPIEDTYAAAITWALAQ